MQDKKRERILLDKTKTISELIGQNDIYIKNVRDINKDNLILEKERDSIEERLDILNKINKFNFNMYMAEKNKIKQLPAEASVKLLLVNTWNESFPIIQVGKDSSFALPLTTIQRSNVAHLERKEYKTKSELLERKVQEKDNYIASQKETIHNDSLIQKNQANQIANHIKIEKAKDVQLDIQDKQINKLTTKLAGTRIFGGIILVTVAVTAFIF